MKTIWKTAGADPARAAALQKGLGCHPVTARILAGRGIATPAMAEAFLSPSLSALRPPDRIMDIDAAAGRLCRAVMEKEPVLVFGDYDADGVTAAALLQGFLARCGADVRVYLPHRLREGYGLQAGQVRRLARGSEIRLIVTVDCGSSSHAALAEAASAGIDVVVTDHHRILKPPAGALAVVNPCRPDCRSGLDMLSGVGVCFYLVAALRKRLREKGFWKNRPEPNLRDYCDLVALGTVADMVPLRDENRILVRTGISVLNRAPRPGLAHLMTASGIKDSGIDAGTLAFRMAPRINAAGRLAHAIAAFRLLSTSDQDTARRIAAMLDRLNRRRKDVEAKMLAEARQLISRKPGMRDRHTIVLSRRNWPEGVLGIVASRLVRGLNRPVVMIAVRDGKAKGSARSIPGIDLHKALEQSADCLDRFGGHAMAAGVALSAGHIEAFRERFEEAVSLQIVDDTFDRPLSIDAEIALCEISDGLVDELERLGPFGEGNPEPLLSARSVHIVSSAPAGSNHLRMSLRQSGDETGRILEAIRFGAGTHAPTSPMRRVAFHLRWNRWKGRRRLQAVVSEIE